MDNLTLWEFLDEDIMGLQVAPLEDAASEPVALPAAAAPTPALEGDNGYPQALLEPALPAQVVGSDFSPLGTDLFGEPIRKGGPLAMRFVMPPVSVLDARSDAWQERKRAWLSLGIKSEVGRDAGAYGSHIGNWMDQQGGGARGEKNGISVFDPVLCELVYRWWCPPGGRVLDPFAGGSVRGIVAGKLGLEYHGCELRGEQVAANREQALQLMEPTEPAVQWHEGDSARLLCWPPKDPPTIPGVDLVFTCPPYGDLEVYSQDPADLSNMPYPTFLAGLQDIMLRTTPYLRPDSFLAIVVGDFRDSKTGGLRGFVADTIKMMQGGGLALYNEAVLVTPMGTLPVRVSAQFDKGRKLGMGHQHLLVFVKGDWRRAVAKCVPKEEAAA